MKQDTTTPIPAQKSVRELAIEWWRTQNRYDKTLYFITFKEKHFSPANDETQLTGREIELIYKAENPEQPKSMLWWNSIPDHEETKRVLVNQYISETLPLSELTSFQIETIYMAEVGKKGKVSDVSMGGFTGWKLRYDEQEFLPQGEKHTYVDSVVDNEGNEICGFLTAHYGQVELFPKYEKIAQRIVTCVNNHDALVVLLRDILDDDKEKGILKAQHRVKVKAILNNINNK